MAPRSVRHCISRIRNHGRHAAISFALILGFVLIVPGARAQDAGAVTLAPGQFIWHPEVAPAGPVVVVVSLDEQRAYVYRNGVAIGVSSISSGRARHETPTGVFTILQKARDHHSNLYNDAPMPFMQRLTWDGIALHAGTVPGYPASHGCVRLPRAFAEKLFAVTQKGDTVVVANAASDPQGIVHPGLLAPVDAQGHEITDWTGLPAAAPGAMPPAGPANVVVSTSDRLAYLLRDGRVLASTPIDPGHDFHVGGSLLYVLKQEDDASVGPHWTVYASSDETPRPPVDDVVGQLRLPPMFLAEVHANLVPGSTVLVTDLPGIRRGIDAPQAPVLESETTEEAAAARTATEPVPSS